ncbi:hypothetical protein HFU84_13845 [Acidithiobacillus sp. CV18-2]|uniref:Uncharacterized protein n=1 Tax=Igneacidithiobacillus copahuensis TaxID=2724909 RepID=A0AAE2YSH4_9PROT|nr:hypothetical protein [Igneacidithiobacillus copahuensis]MBU2755737.1 hypothetical protein [Acidithiobacillus sp. CV18-3]MBU2757080.1 hypothetical protein [Acidithiobacillus sp. BN09-2]MBU2778556.1 hypothetical protein [Acidithiobacillus sp. CV18-2]MBU2797672.1 hypothetical protein [Acidithiobacillus sp. VAN18-2]MBU2798170.1 hypothetical protein [Acidithiobacillus sp. VAN18-4]UTV82254.1 hypothetical protein MQE22_06465 [Acidithiobacillus sp. YTS05]
MFTVPILLHRDIAEENLRADTSLRLAVAIWYFNRSLLVKENYGMDKPLTGVTAVPKLSGYAAGNQNGVMTIYFPDQEVNPVYLARLQRYPKEVIK